MKDPRLLGVATGLLVATLCGHAGAETSDHEKAIGAFEEGRLLIDGGKCDAAVARLKESIAYEPSVGARLSLADCYEKSDVLAAWRALKDAALLAYMNHDERFGIAQSRAAALEKTLPTIRIIVPRSVIDEPGFEVRIDRTIVDRFDYRGGVIATTPGQHLIEASASKHRWTKNVLTEPGKSVEVTADLHLELVEDAPSARPPSATVIVAPPTVDDPGAGRRTLGLLVGGAGLVGLGVGSAFGVIALQKKTDLQIACGGRTDVCAAAPGSLDQEKSSAQTASTLSTVGFIAGGALLAGGLVLVLTAPKRPAAGGATVRAIPTVGKSDAGLNLVGVW